MHDIGPQETLMIIYLSEECNISWYLESFRH